MSPLAPLAPADAEQLDRVREQLRALRFELGLLPRVASSEITDRYFGQRADDELRCLERAIRRETL